MHTLFVVNPLAKRGQCLSRWRKLEQCLQQNAEFSFDVRLTSRRGEAKEIVLNHVEHYDRIIAVGGDGTLNEVVNGCVGHRVSIGVVPFGTGNDLARLFRISDDATVLQRMLNANVTQSVNIGRVNHEYFINTSGAGFDGLIAHEVNQTPSLKRLGALGYVGSMLKQWTTFQPFTIRLVRDGKETVIPDTWLIAVGNGQYYGGGMKVFPEANPSDGLFDVCVVHGLGKFKFLRLMPSVYTGKHLKYLTYVDYSKAASIQIEASEPLHGHRDGELVTSTLIDIGVSEHQIPFLIV